MDFLSIAMATFGIFRVKMPDGGTRDFLMYIVRGLESCKFNHFTALEAKSINTKTSKHANLHNVIQYVTGGAIFRLNKLDSKSNKNLPLQIQEWSNNHARYLSYALSGRKDVRVPGSTALVSNFVTAIVQIMYGKICTRSFLSTAIYLLPHLRAKGSKRISRHHKF